ncbi:hypothetical protein ACFVIY_39900 [Streptomyces sp. NPDC127166]|uniref:hypothetical protein n=1 Tax=Streptomyces sp. NPDC127166 TaxID=3345380 RepID=UPI00363215A7
MYGNAAHHPDRVRRYPSDMTDGHDGRKVGGRPAVAGGGVLPEQDQPRGSVGRGFHRCDRVAENGELDGLAGIVYGGEGGQAREMPAGRESDHADAVRVLFAPAADLGPQRQEGFGMPYVEWVAEDARRHAQCREPRNDGLGLVRGVHGMAPAGRTIRCVVAGCT